MSIDQLLSKETDRREFLEKAGGNKRTLLVQKNKEIMKSGKAKLYG